ncbi:MAG: DUF1501 domain-containing protein [Acidobacteria bacterium]|nr:DUF1501 domain-containing protein [Acidobacteriota bacterium]
MLRMFGAGFGEIGLSRLLAEQSSPKPHFPARAKHVIFLFLNGGPSQVDTFDPKPALTKYHGKAIPSGNLKTERKTGNLLKSPFEFRRCGRSGIEISEIFPKLGECIDDLCVIRSMHTERPNHEPSLFMLNTGAPLPGRPSLGSWLTYGLGTENQNLPGYFVLCPGLPVIGPQLWSSAFLPAKYQGTYIANNEKDAKKLIPFISGGRPPEEQRRQLDLLARINRMELAHQPDEPQLEATIQSMETAFGMQVEAPEIFDIGKEPASLRARYGDSDFGRGCLMAVRLVQKGVRMVQIYFGNGQPWDNHDDILIHRKLAAQADPAIAALLQDLKARGLLEETLVIIGGEFGRTPSVEVSGLVSVQNGRDHNSHGFSLLLAGGGIKRGITYGATDEFGFKAVEKPVHPHDLQATILHLFGFDHTKLTYRYSGRDFRLTDVGGTVVQEILA